MHRWHRDIMSKVNGKIDCCLKEEEDFSVQAMRVVQSCCFEYLEVSYMHRWHRDIVSKVIELFLFLLQLSLQIITLDLLRLNF